MGVISKKLASRFRKAKKQVSDLRRQATTDFAQVPRDVKTVQALLRSVHDPLHAAYVAAQNFTSFFAEAVSQFPDFDPYCNVVGPAEEEYLPNGPPHSPLTRSFFTTWAFFDVRFGPDRETIGTCLLDLADLLGMDPFMAETIRRFQDSRMGIYECGGIEDGRCRLRELVTDDSFLCHVASGYQGKPGELWYVEPVHAPPKPFHILAQQLLALVLQERGIGQRAWFEWVSDVPAFAQMDPPRVEEVVQHLLVTGILWSDNGILSFGPEGEAEFWKPENESQSYD